MAGWPRPSAERAGVSGISQSTPPFSSEETPPYKSESHKQLHTDGVGFRSLTDQIDTTTPAGRFFFNIMASLAQMERELTIERTQAGLAAARAKGHHPGRKRLMTESKIASAIKLLEAGTTPAEVAHDLGVSIPTLYRWVPANGTS